MVFVFLAQPVHPGPFLSYTNGEMHLCSDSDSASAPHLLIYAAGCGIVWGSPPACHGVAVPCGTPEKGPRRKGAESAAADKEEIQGNPNPPGWAGE